MAHMKYCLLLLLFKLLVACGGEGGESSMSMHSEDTTSPSTSSSIWHLSSSESSITFSVSSSASSKTIFPDTFEDFKTRFPNLQGCNFPAGEFVAQLEQLSCAEVSDFSGLEYFDWVGIAHFYGISELSITQPVRIFDLNVYIDDSKSKILDLSGVRDLQTLNYHGYGELNEVMFSSSAKRSMKDIYFRDATLGSMEFSDFISLERLEIIFSRLQEIQLARLPNLRIIKLNNNGLERFNISGAPKLDGLYLSNNKLNRIDLQGMPELKTVELKNNQFVELSVPAEFEALSVYLEGNPLNCSSLMALQERFPRVSTYYHFGTSLCVQDSSDINYETYLPALQIGSSQLNTCLRRTAYRFTTDVMELNCATSDITGIDTLVNLNQLSINQVASEQLNLLDSLPIETLTLKAISGKSLDFSGMASLVNLTLDGSESLVDVNLLENHRLEYLAIYEMPVLSNLQLHDKRILKELAASGASGLNIEEYTGLKSLTLNLDLADIDVSQLLELETLTMFAYPRVKIDLSKHEKLLDLMFSGTDAFSSLELPSPSSLENLEVHQLGLLNRLDLSEQHLLSHFTMSNIVSPMEVVFPSKPSQLKTISAGSTYSVSHLDLKEQNNLEKIFLDYGGFQTIDLPRGENNLKEIKARINNLSELDLSHSAQLEFLNLSNNKFSQIDLSHNHRLEALYLVENDLLSIDLSENMNLKFLGLSKNYNLAKLDLSANTLLESVSLSRMNLVNIDLSNNPLIRDLYFYGSEQLCANLNEIISPLSMLDPSENIGCD